MKKYIALTLALLMSLSLMACGSKTDDGSTDADGSGDQEGSNTLVLGTSADYAPFEFMYADESGTMQYAGIDISAAQYVADEMGKELQIENMSFDYLLTSLAKGDYDIVMAAMEATPERLASADFSDPYYTDIPPMILVKADNAAQYATLADFDGKSVGAQAATTKETVVTDQLPGANLVSLSLVTDLVNELVYGKVDAVVLDGAVAQEYAETNPDLAIAPASSELGEAQPYCIAVAKGDPKGLLPAINEAIAKMQSENKLADFITAANELSGKAVDVTADDKKKKKRVPLSFLLLSSLPSLIAKEQSPMALLFGASTAKIRIVFSLLKGDLSHGSCHTVEQPLCRYVSGVVYQLFLPAEIRRVLFAGARIYAPARGRVGCTGSSSGAAAGVHASEQKPSCARRFGCVYRGLSLHAAARAALDHLLRSFRRDLHSTPVPLWVYRHFPLYPRRCGAGAQQLRLCR